MESSGRESGQVRSRSRLFDTLSVGITAEMQRAL